ncbi:MAG: HAMP domain-containing histidine kinase [Prolixibacteraceae bacterium]|jgi:signal transduction histidine kinase|nr:HAMP domain-containing histidine kinase [Prolixibacteraceae bacterium]MBT6005429.1 HAMP domain-containing histidine kinase [Prolixibacteraceae bacterium]MBT6766896.1 HAMP domain-containing histidine kinase [Prolixibacteraceae bacterium]MBT7397052.1 HAMP domain-containing histidine kinase [Prolixibacteraceae bacterium]
MKLLNYTLFYLSATLFAIVSLWAVLFYFQLLNQVKFTIDEGLANYKILIIDKLKDDSQLIPQDSFGDKNYIVKSVNEEYALQIRDTYKDTLIFSTVKNIFESNRLLTTAFVAEDGLYYEMQVISQELDRNKLIKELATSLLWLYLFLLICILLVNNFVLKNAWKPFYELLNYLKDFRLDKGSLNEPAKTKIKEFSILNETILKLLKDNVDVYSSQKQFIENASHELQTPLAIGINKLELLADEKDLSDGNIKKIGNIIQTLQSLADLNKSLLLISKIENKQFLVEEQVNFDDIFTRIINDFSDFTEYRKIEINYKKEGDLIFKMNKNLAEILIMNLVKNAIIHNQPGGEIAIKLSSSQFTIENTSDEPALSTDEIFKRFSKSQNKTGSTGLGLAIAKTITDVSGLSIKYSYTGEHIFKVGSEPE